MIVFSNWSSVFPPYHILLPSLEAPPCCTFRSSYSSNAIYLRPEHQNIVYIGCNQLLSHNVSNRVKARRYLATLSILSLHKGRGNVGPRYISIHRLFLFEIQTY